MKEHITVARVLADYLETTRGSVIRIDQIEYSTTSLTKLIGDVDVTDRRGLARAVQRYTAKRLEAVKASTVRRNLVVLRAALTSAWRHGRLDVRPSVVMPRFRGRREIWITPQQAQALIGAANPRIVLFIRVALATGARLTALLELSWDRVDLDQGIVDFTAPHPLQHRQKRRAIVPVTGITLDELRRARQLAGDEPRVFPFTASNLRRMFRAACRKAKLRAVTTHTLRHSVATWMLASDIPLPKVSKMLGHSSSAVTEQVYGHLDARHLREIAQILSGLVAPKNSDAAT